MFKNLTYKQKNLFLAIGFIVFSIVIYRAALAKTFHLAGEITTLEKDLNRAQNASMQIAELTAKLKKIEGAIGAGGTDPSAVLQELLEMVTDHCNKHRVVLQEFAKPHQYRDGNYLVKTSAITVKGAYVKLLKLAYEIEQHYKAGKVVALHFEKEKDYRTNRTDLYATIYVQHIDKTENYETP